MEVLIALLSLVVGLVFGVVIGKSSAKETPVGTLRADVSDPDEPPYLFLQLPPTTDPYKLIRKKRVTLDVKIQNFISHN